MKGSRFYLLMFLIVIGLIGCGAGVSGRATNLTGVEIPAGVDDLIWQVMPERAGLTGINISYTALLEQPLMPGDDVSVCYELTTVGPMQPKTYYGVASRGRGGWAVSRPDPFLVLAGCPGS